MDDLSSFGQPCATRPRSRPPRTDCPNLAASHLCRSIPWAWALNTPQPIQCVIQVHIPGLHSATNPESSKDRGWTTGSTPSTTTTRSRSNCGIRAVRASPAAYVPARLFLCAALICASRPPPCSALPPQPLSPALALAQLLSCPVLLVKGSWRRRGTQRSTPRF